MIHIDKPACHQNSEAIMLFLLLLFAFFIPSAGATWSIVAVDPATGQIGGAGTSCVGTLDVSIIFGAAPGKGAVHAQAYFNEQGRDQAVELLTQGVAPTEIITTITGSSFDPQSSYRQYGIVDMQGRSAGFTGQNTTQWTGDIQGSVNGIIYSAQGNILTGQPVVQRTFDRFAAQTSCDLTANLWEALKAGRAESEGDSRCTPNGIPSDSAFIRVVDSAGNIIVNLSVVGDSPEDPLDRLQVLFDQWRATSPCPVAETPAAEPKQEQNTGCQFIAAPTSLILCIPMLLAVRRRS